MRRTILHSLRLVRLPHLCHVVRQRVVGVRLVEEVDQAVDDGVDVEDRLPVLPQNVEADVALEVDVRVEDFGIAVDLRRLVRVHGRDREGEVVGQGTGDLKNHLDELKQNDIKLYVSGMSAKARGYDESLLDGFNAEFAMPDRLLTLSTESDAVLCY